jgi:hypothetical protein
MSSEYVGKGINNMKLIIMAFVLRIEPLHSLSNSLETVTRCMILLLRIFSPLVLGPNVGHGLLILEISRSHTTTHYSR